MRLIFLGPPGSGKGTQAQRLCQREHLEHVGTGDLIRHAMREGTPMGERARPFVESGQLVPDDLVNGLVDERFRAADRPERFVMDGYPRTVAQAQTFDRLLKDVELCLTCVLLLEVEDSEILRRLSGRWSCPNPRCRAIYQLQTHPPRVPGVCDVCGSKLIQRQDDRVETIQARLRVYHESTRALIPYYQGQGLLREVAGQGEIETVYQNLRTVVSGQAGASC